MDCQRLTGKIAFLISLSCLAIVRAEAVESAAPGRKTSWDQSHVKGRPEPKLPYKPEAAFPLLQLKQPVTLTSAPGMSRLFVVQLAGEIVSFPDSAAADKLDVLMDVRDVDPKVKHTYGMTFHPKFPDQPYVYVCYVRKGTEPDGTVVSRFTVRELDPPRVEPDSEVQLVRWLAGGHNGCSLKFGPDGFLYISTGDGTGPNPPDALRAGQDVSNLLSSILRIDVDHQEPGRNYAIPSDNPFLQWKGARPEIYAFGFRNPWKMSFDRETGDLWVGDVGWDMWELVFRVEKGGNYGWSIMEGSNPILPEQKRGPGPILPPVTQHHHSEARSITGGFVYHGKDLPSLKGAYIYGDYNTGKIWSLRHDGQRVTSRQELADTGHQIIGWAESHDGELYYADYQRTNRIYKLAPNDAPDASENFPRKLSDTGLFQSVRDLQPAAGVEHYEVNASPWEDGAVAIRHLAVPGNLQITWQDNGHLAFPADTVIARTVIKQINGIARRMETQILHQDGNIWRPYSYIWNTAQDDATLGPPNGLSSSGTSKSDGNVLPYRVHSRVECRLCHTKPMGVVLGLQLAQLRPGALRTAGLLERWRRDGLLAGNPPLNSISHPRLVDPYEGTANLTLRARSYLHVNCVSCHRPGGGGPSPIHLDFQRSLGEANIINATPVQGDFGIPNAKIVSPGDPFRSILFYRMAKLGSGHMPHLGSRELDEAGLHMMHNWIKSLESTGETLDVPQIEKYLETPQTTLELAWRMRSVETPPRLRDEIVKLAIASSQPHVRDLMEPFYPAELRTPRLGTRFDYSVVLERDGVAQQGREIFTRLQCAQCHRLENTGGELGPPVEAFAKKHLQPRAMLDAIVRPSAEMDPAFRTHRVVTTDGAILSGRIISQSDDVVVLLSENNKRLEIAQDDIEERTLSRLSIMPEYLLQGISPQDAADLLAFLQAP